MMPGLQIRSLLLLLVMSPLAARAQTEQPAPAAAVPTPAAAVPTTSVAVPAQSAEALPNLPPSEDIADLLNARGRFLAAIHVYEALPPTARILNKLGMACEHMYMYDRARASFAAALKLNPKFPEAYNNLGTLAHSQGDTRTAEKMYRKALALKPDAPSTLLNLGTLLYAERKYKKGDEAYRKAIQLDPEILTHNGERSVQARTKGDSVSEIHYHMAMNYAQAGSRQMALQYLRQAITEGFRDRNRLLHEKEFADLRTTDTFLQMVDDLKNN